jgi:hypothetical protein
MRTATAEMAQHEWRINRSSRRVACETKECSRHGCLQSIIRSFLIRSDFVILRHAFSSPVFANASLVSAQERVGTSSPCRSIPLRCHRARPGGTVAAATPQRVGSRQGGTRCPQRVGPATAGRLCRLIYSRLQSDCSGRRVACSTTTSQATRLPPQMARGSATPATTIH